MWILYCLCLVASATGQDDVRLPPSITENPEREVIFRESHNITLLCKATGTQPITFEWRQNGNRRSPTSSTSTSSVASVGYLTIFNATRRDYGFYQCFATNQYGTALSTVAYIQHAFIQNSSQNYVNITVQEGHPFVLQAARINSFPTPTYSWEIVESDVDKNPRPFKTSQIGQLSQRVRDTWEGDLHFAYALEEDELNGSIYKSTVFNGSDKTSLGESYTRVTVIKNSGSPPDFPPNITYFAKLQNVAPIGRDIELKCFFSGKPLPNITWSRSWNSLPSGRHSIPDSHYKTLLKLSNMTESDEGDYVCTASNINGTVSHTFNIRAEAAPVFSQESDGPYNVNVTEGDSITFNCSTFAKPEATVVWLQNGEPIDVTKAPKRFGFSNDSRSLTIRDVCRDCVDRERQTDLMVIQCNASNVHGYVFASGYLNIVEPPACEGATWIVLISSTLIGALLMLVVGLIVGLRCKGLSKYRAVSARDQHEYYRTRATMDSFYETIRDDGGINQHRLSRPMTANTSFTERQTSRPLVGIPGSTQPQRSGEEEHEYYPKEDGRRPSTTGSDDRTTMKAPHYLTISD